jgi:hypothetical protein
VPACLAMSLEDEQLPCLICPDAVVPEPNVPLGARPAPSEDVISPRTLALCWITVGVRWFAESRPHPYERYR